MFGLKCKEDLDKKYNNWKSNNKNQQYNSYENQKTGTNIDNKDMSIISNLTSSDEEDENNLEFLDNDLMKTYPIVDENQKFQDNNSKFLNTKNDKENSNNVSEIQKTLQKYNINYSNLLSKTCKEIKDNDQLNYSNLQQIIEKYNKNLISMLNENYKKSEGIINNYSKQCNNLYQENLEIFNQIENNFSDLNERLSFLLKKIESLNNLNSNVDSNINSNLITETRYIPFFQKETYSTDNCFTNLYNSHIDMQVELIGCIKENNYIYPFGKENLKINLPKNDLTLNMTDNEHNEYKIICDIQEDENFYIKFNIKNVYDINDNTININDIKLPSLIKWSYDF